MLEFLITTSFVAGLIPALVLFILYGVFTRWQASFTGRGLFSVLLVTVVSYALSVAVRIRPDVFEQEWAEWIRIVVRFSIALVLWNFLRVFLKAQRSGQAIHEGNSHDPREP